MAFEEGEQVYIVESHLHVTPALIIKKSGENFPALIKVCIFRGQADESSPARDPDDVAAIGCRFFDHLFMDGDAHSLLFPFFFCII